LNRTRKIITLLLLALLLGGGAYWVSIANGWTAYQGAKRKPLDAQTLDFNGTSFDVLKVDPAKQELRLYWKGHDGLPYRDFETLRLELEKEGRQLRFATNAGIFSEDHTPGGLHIENGHTLRNLNLRDGGGNFHMKPNGVFVLGAEGAGVLESEEYSQSGKQPTIATQSGPMLVIDGQIHPDFREGSDNRFIRNGVGVDEQGMIWFAISNERVNFYDFSHLFLDRLGCKDALYLDGSISEFYLPDLDRTSTAGNFCGILALVE
jgi:uncharacterized protein YigE (DUF2233 family)